MAKKGRRQPLDVNLGELDAIIESTREKTLDDSERSTLRDAVHAMAARLAYQMRSSEKTADLAGSDPKGSGRGAAESPPRPPREGHGRNGVDLFTGAERVPVKHESLEHGGPCPCDCGGKVYLQKDPARPIRFVGGPPIQATVYELDRLRCNLCGEVYTAAPPAGVSEDKYDETVSSMVALAKYGHGIPFNRLESIQQQMGVPLPSSNQWELVQDAAAVLEPVHEELLRIAAQSEVLYADDTGMTTLQVGREEGDKRTGLFTTAVVGEVGENKVAVFFTGTQHAGENVRDLLAQRAEDAGPAVLMCDALSRNVPKGLSPHVELLIANCLAHGRRHFVNVLDNFPEECTEALEQLGRVYGYDEEARKQNLDPKQRLAFHQQHSGPVMKELRQRLGDQLNGHVEPNSGLGKAMKYLLTHWNALTLFLRRPGAPLDNNICERALKKVVLLRKNALFYRSRTGAQVGDLFLALIHTCFLNGVNPFDYLTELQRHPDEIRTTPAAWMPWNFRASRRPAPD